LVDLAPTTHQQRPAPGHTTSRCLSVFAASCALAPASETLINPVALVFRFASIKDPANLAVVAKRFAGAS